MSLPKVYYRSMSCFAMDSLAKGPACNAKDFPAKDPSCTMWLKQITKYDTWSDVNSHSTEQDTQHITFLICRQAVPYWTRCGACCPGVSTAKIWSLTYLSTTCHDSIKHLHHFNCCSNHIINPHTVNWHLDGWKTTTLSQRHKTNSTSQRMEDLYNSQDC
jgi:hypothetical protein